MVMDNATESKAIRQRMEEVRRDLDEDVQDIVEGSRDMGDWRSYVRTYPWVCLGAALAVGYLIVPRRHLGMQPDAQTLAELANQSRLLATSDLPPKGNVRGMLLAFVGNLVMRGVSSYVGEQAGKLMATRATKPQQDDQR
jgi:hypothetical protein